MPDSILSGWLILIAIEYLTVVIDYFFFNEPLLSSSFLLLNPALYFYIRSLTQNSFELRMQHLLHLLPFLFFEIYAYLFQVTFSLHDFFVADKNFVFRLLFALANFASWSLYNPLSLIMVHRHRMHLKNELSRIEKQENLSWVLSVSVWYVVYCIFAFVISVITFFQNYPTDLPHIYNYATLLVIVFLLSFYGLRQQRLPANQLKPLTQSYQSSSLDLSDKESIQQKLIAYVETEKVWLNPELTLNCISEALRIPKHHLTEVLNTFMGVNFFQFINGYRIHAVQQMLVDPGNHFSIEAIGYECGFASKSSFYTVFKKMTGLTPMEFRNTKSSH